MKVKTIVAVFWIITLTATALTPVRVFAQLTAGITAQQLFVDPKTGQVFIRPGRGRVPLKIQGANAADIQQQVDQQVDERVRESEAQLQASNAQLQASNADLEQKVATMQTDWRSYATTFGSRVKIGALVYADWSLYTHTGWGPQFTENVNPPGPDNDNYNSFDITRAYINLIFTPVDDWSLRITPDIYRTIGSSNVKFGTNSALNSNLNGNDGYRLKYTYLRYAKPFQYIDSMKTDTVTFGMQAEPLVDWEEQLFGYRYVTLVPWNYAGFSSSYTGISVQGPIVFNEKQYVDYDFGVYDNGNFHNTEATNTKGPMARFSFYPLGAKWRFDGLGITWFGMYGWGNSTPDASQLPVPNPPPPQPPAFANRAGSSSLYRMAALLHYSTEQMGLAFEFDLGKNAFTTSNLFSASGPPQQFGQTGPASFALFNSMANGILNTGDAKQRGFDFFGHYHFPDTPFTIFGLGQWWMPNTQINVNPLDFYRYAIGVSYQVNEFLRFALDYQNLTYYHSQFTFPAGEVLGVTSGTGAATHAVPVPNAVPRDTNVFFLNMEFNY